MAAYYLQMQPHLFQDAVRTAFQRIKEAREADQAAAKQKEDEASECMLRVCGTINAR